ncbi:DUF1499 domain-containing protein [Maritalea mediterranea]|uniref:DUF1499 domain-containing protein n=1 Tax=Maritalea mediterranea TaxID=2909667 RepID=A0ABS9E8V4_9HYPH|nr:DUF1499 domain-containing protein [Maritalea mediterranea]MCF4097891.1 DUF1499 domain-containing protein [Maritalea mediterranea]
MARLVIPLFIVAIGAHHIELIDSTIFVVLFAMATFLGVTALGLGMIAFVRLWYTGDHGWGMASWANLVGVGTAVTLALTVLLGTQYPQANQVSTNIESPPLLGVAVLDSEAKLKELERMATEVAVSFPTAVTRAYPLGTDEMLPLLERQISAADWGGSVTRQFSSQDTTRYQGDVKTWLGFKDRVAIRAIHDEMQTEIDMRSASYFGEADMGANGRRVQDFLADLDAAVRQKLLQLSRQAPLQEEPISDEVEIEAGE